MGALPLPRAEICQRISVGALRPQLPADAKTCRLGDGAHLRLRWVPIKGCYGGQGGRALLMVCPCCDRSVRVLWRPPRQTWGCCRCRPVSHPSHRRSGSRSGRSKPATWKLAQIRQDQVRTARLLGLRYWPPMRLFWNHQDLLEIPFRPDAPRLSAERQEALFVRLEILEKLRLGTFLANHRLSPLHLHDPKLIRTMAFDHSVLEATAWAVRRPGRGSRTQNRPAKQPNDLRAGGSTEE